jgi:hypothetical protein
MKTTRGHMRQKDRERLKKTTVVRQCSPWVDTPCLIWTGPREVSGYGYFLDYPHWNWPGVKISLHVYVWTEDRGRGLPPGWLVHHKCEVKRCCNPDHLKAMTRRYHAWLHAKARNGDLDAMRLLHGQMRTARKRRPWPKEMRMASAHFLTGI